MPNLTPLQALRAAVAAGPSAGLPPPAVAVPDPGRGPVPVLPPVPASAPPNPSLRLDASLGLVVLEFRDSDGEARTIPSERELEAYRSAARGASLAPGSPAPPAAAPEPAAPAPEPQGRPASTADQD